MQISNNNNTPAPISSKNTITSSTDVSPDFKLDGKNSHSFKIKEVDPDYTPEHLRLISLEEFKKLEAKAGEMSPMEVWHYSQFTMTEEYSDYRKEQSLENGKLRETERVIIVGDERIVYKNGSVSRTNNIEQYFVPGDREATLENIYAAFGVKNVEVANYAKGESPTNAELFEQLTGKSYYRHVMSDGRFG